MKYRRKDAKDYARENMRGIWAAAMTPFDPDLSLDERGYLRNMRHWVRDLKIDGLFISGKQGEFSSMSIAERKRSFELAVEATKDQGSTIMSCSDQNIETVIELAKHAQAVGSDYVVIHAPVLYFFEAQDQTVYEYYKYISEQIDIGIAMWSHPDSGYLMSPELCARIAEMPNIVAIKYSVRREMYARLTNLARERLIVSTASEDEWLDNIVELGWQVYLCSTPPYLMQTKTDLRMREYTDLAMRGDVKRARTVRNSLDPVRTALRETRPPEKPQAHQKYWQELLGQVGGPTRRPQIQLTDSEKAATRTAFENCGLRGAAGAPRISIV
jgi:4-hydroxy-tetrahydrodipicolinate synthase